MKRKLLMPLVIPAVLYACSPAQNKTEKKDQPAETQNPVEKGKALVASLGCNDCHSPKMMTPVGPAPDTARMLSGHPSNEKLPPYDKATAASYVLFNMGQTAAIGPWGTSFAANLTSDATGVGNWTEDQFMRAMKLGKWKGLENSRQLLPPMPWESYSKLPDEDIKAIFAYLKSVKPVKNLVPAALPPATK